MTLGYIMGHYDAMVRNYHDVLAAGFVLAAFLIAAGAIAIWLSSLGGECKWK